MASVIEKHVNCDAALNGCDYVYSLWEGITIWLCRQPDNRVHYTNGSNLFCWYGKLYHTLEHMNAAQH